MLLSASASWAEVGYDSDLSASIDANGGLLKKITIPTGSFDNPDVEGVRGFFINMVLGLTTNYYSI